MICFDMSLLIFLDTKSEVMRYNEDESLHYEIIGGCVLSAVISKIQAKKPYYEKGIVYSDEVECFCVGSTVLFVLLQPNINFSWSFSLHVICFYYNYYSFLTNFS